MRERQVWITGSSGFLGQALSRRLEAEGFHVVGISRRGKLKIDLSQSDAVTKLKDLVKKDGAPQALVHLASRQPASGIAFSEYLRGNVLAGAHVREALEESMPVRVIVVSTLSVYGNQPVFVETSEPSPETFYAKTKWWGEQIWDDLPKETRRMILRIPSLYGVGQEDSFIDGLARRIRRGEIVELFDRGEKIRDTLPVSRVVDGILLALNRDWGTKELLNLGCGTAVSASDYAGWLAKRWGVEDHLRLSDRKGSSSGAGYADIRRSREVLGFEPNSWKKNLEEYVCELEALS